MSNNKSQELYLLLNKYDRESQLNIQFSQDCIGDFPYFYLLNWNYKFDHIEQRKIALQSPFRSAYYYSILDAPLNNLRSDTIVEGNDLEKEDIINKFLMNQPIINRFKNTEEGSLDISDLSLANYSPPVSETFALILIKQGKISLAIDIYNKLILSKPEKRLYFATRISELSKILNLE